MKVAPCPLISNDVLHASFRQTVQKVERKQYRKLQNFQKTKFRDLVNSKLLLNRNELEKTIRIKKMRLNDINPTVYHLAHSDKWFRKKREKTLAATRHPPHYF